MADALSASEDDLARAFRVLVLLLYDEYPRDFSLVEIAETWANGVSKEDIAALERVEQFYSSS